MNRRHPAEWEKQRAVWLAWPHNVKEWRADRLPRIRQFVRTLIETVLEFQDVRLALTDEGMRSDIAPILRALRPHACLPVVIPNNDIWIRDYGPFFVESESPAPRPPLVLDFGFNAWGEKFPPWDLDDIFPSAAARSLGLEIERRSMILEGGSVEFSGDGILMTTEQCLLNPNRNPGMDRAGIEQELKSAFGVEAFVWLRRGLDGDHTDGHIDDIARFVGPRTVLACRCNDSRDSNFDRLAENIDILRRWRHPKTDETLAVIEIPMPHRMDLGPNRLPNSYVNFIFVNGGLIVSTFGGETDAVALDILRGLFPDRRVVGIDSTLLIEEGGGLHCMTKQEPLPSP